MDLHTSEKLGCYCYLIETFAIIMVRQFFLFSVRYGVIGPGASFHYVKKQMSFKSFAILADRIACP